MELLRESVTEPMPMAVRVVEPSPRITLCELQEGKGIKDEKREQSPVMCIVAPLSKIIRRRFALEKWWL